MKNLLLIVATLSIMHMFDKIDDNKTHSKIKEINCATQGSIRCPKNLKITPHVFN